MGISVHSLSRYLTTDGLWRNSDYAAMNFVKALKGEPMKGWANLDIAGHKISLSMDRPEEALPWFGSTVAGLFNWNDGRKLLLCPMPDSECTTTSERASKVLPLAESIASHLPKIAIWDGLRWKKALKKARLGGPREPEILFPNLDLIRPVPTDKQIVIIDDVCTTGGHVQAVEALIRRGGGTVASAICASRTAHDQTRSALGLLTDEFPEYKPKLGTSKA